MIDITPTTGELLWIWRKRERLTVSTAAKRLNATHALYLQAENGEVILQDQPAIHPSQAELLRILRRRSGEHRDTLCAAIGVSHVKYLKMERTVDPVLVAHWAAKTGTP